MSREIKFRAWTPDGMKHFDDLVLRDCGGFRHPRSYRIACNAEENTEYIHDDFACDVLKDEYAIMQYTGLKDKNGKEVYEGDVVLVSGFYDPETGQTENDLCVVEYRGISLCYVEYHATEGGSGSRVHPVEDLIGHNCDTDNDAEVIGNVWESPELIKP